MSQDASKDLLERAMPEVNREFLDLAYYLGVEGIKPIDPDSKPYYTNEDVSKVRAALDLALAEMDLRLKSSGNTQELPPGMKESMLASALYDGYLKRSPMPDPRISDESIFNLIKDAEINMRVLDKVASESAAAEYKATASYVSNEHSIQEGADPRIKRLEEALAEIVPELNALTTESRVDISFDGTIKMPGKADGFLDADSLESYRDTMQHLNFLAKVNDNKSTAFLFGIDKNQPREFIDENAESIKNLLERKLSENIDEKNARLKELLKNPKGHEAEIRALNDRVSELEELRKSVPDIMKDIADLHKEGKLSQAVEPPKIVAPADSEAEIKTTSAIEPRKEEVKPDDSPMTEEELANIQRKVQETDESNKKVLEKGDISEQIAFVKGALFVLSNKIQEMDSIGITSAVVTPLTEEDLKGNDFGENFQDILAKAIVLVRTVDGDENPNGVYSPEVGERLKRAILTNDMLQPIRDALGVPQMDPNIAKKYFASTIDFSDEEIAKHEEYKRRVDIRLGLVNKDDPEDVNKLDKFITSLNAMHDHNGKNLLDPHKKAKDITTMNIMLDGIAASMEKWAPGMLGFLEDFFKNSEFGKMIGGILAMFGINVGRLWGDKDDEAALERAKPAVEDGFGFFYDLAEKNLIDQGERPDVADIVGKMKTDMLEKLNGSGEGWSGWLQKMAFDKSMNALFDGQGKEFIGGILGNALDEAAKADSPEAAKAAFADYIVEASKIYRQEQNITIEQLSERLANAENTIKAAAREEPKFAAAPVSPASVAAAKSANPANIIKAGDVEVTLAFDLNETGFEQDPLRYSYGRVGEMQEVLGDAQNHEKLGLTIPIDKLKQSDGRFTDTATRHTSAIFEELVIRAKVHDLVKKYDVTPDEDDHVTKADIERINASDNKLSQFNLDLVVAYMRDKGISEADIKKFYDPAYELANDYRSTDPADKFAGPDVNSSVLEQAFYGNQFKVGINIPAPAQKVERVVVADPPKAERVVVDDPPEVERVVVDDPPRAEESLTRNFNASCGANPQTFKDLDDFSTAQRSILASKGINVDEIFEEALGSIQNGESQFVIWEMERSNLDKITGLPDVIVGMRYGNNIILKSVDYACDNIRSLAIQRRDGLADIGQRHNAPDAVRRLDDFLDERERFPGGVIKQGSVGGYPRMLGLVPNPDGDGVIVQTAMRAVYGDISLTPTAYTEYAAAYFFRHTDRTGFERVMEARAKGADPHGITDPTVKYAGRQPPPQEPRQSTARGHILVDAFNAFKDSLTGDDEKPDANKAIEQNIVDMKMKGAPVEESIPVYDVTRSSGYTSGMGAGTRH